MNREDIIDGTVTLTLDNDEELECEVVSIFETGDREYISLLPLGGEEEENGEVFIYRFKLSEDGEPDLENIEDDAEYEMAADAFDEALDKMEFDEIVEEDEEEE